MENSKEFADKLFGICRGRGTLSQMKALTRISSERWNMNIDGMLTEDEVKKVATQMITKRRLPLFHRTTRMIHGWSRTITCEDDSWPIGNGQFHHTARR
uniref:Uncharacterized protein n=1 Tax=Aegilops tauschii TaxID=37682 RepID=R7WEV4_AEGTA